MALTYTEVVKAGPGWTTVRTEDGREVTVKGTRSTRNNNPGNLEYGAFAQRHGAIGTDGRFAVFPDRTTGVRAISGLVFGGSYKDLTIAQAISKYAPSHENNTKAYANRVAAAAGASLDTKMSDLPASARDAVAEAITTVEGLGKATLYEDGRKIGVIDPRRTSTVADVQRQSLPEVGPLPSFAERAAPRNNLTSPNEMAYGPAPMPGRGLLGEVVAPAPAQRGLLGDAVSQPGLPQGVMDRMNPRSMPAVPTPSPANLRSSVMDRMNPPSMAPVPTPAPRSVSSALPNSVQERMAGLPLSDRQVTAAVPGMSPAGPVLSMFSPPIDARTSRPSAQAALSPAVQERMAGFPDAPQRADLSPAVQERMGGFPSAPAPTQRAPTPDLAPSVMERMGGLLSMDAQAATMPNSRADGLLADTPPSFGVPDAIAYATPVPSYQAPPASYQTPAFSTAKPQMDALGQPPIPGLQRAPQRQAAAPAPAAPAYTAPRDVAPAPTIAGPVGRQRAEQAPTRSNISSPTADRNAAQAAAAAALSEVSSRGKSGGMFSGGFSGPSGVMGGAMLGGAVAGLPGAAIGGLLGSQTVRDSIGLGGLGGGSGYGTGQLSAGALSALNAGWGGFGGMTPTQQLAVGLARQQEAQQQAQAARAGLFDGWGVAGNQASSSAIGGRTTSYRDGRTSMGGEGGFGSGTMSDSARSSARGGGGLF